MTPEHFVSDKEYRTAVLEATFSDNTLEYEQVRLGCYCGWWTQWFNFVETCCDDYAEHYHESLITVDR